MDKTMAKLSQSIVQLPQQLNSSRLNLFFIKSKHAFRQFKNHDYFQNRPVRSISRKSTKINQFVEFPAPYGINNAYNYICNEASKSLIPRHQPQRRRNKTDVDLRHSSMKTKCNIFSSDPKRNTHFCLPGLTLSDLRKQETLYNQTIINSIPARIERPHPKSDEIVQLTFIDQNIQPQKWKNYQLKVNIYNHILSTFLKSRINYQQMTQQQFITLKNLIVEIYGTQKEYIEYKDIVNIRSLRQVFTVLQGENYQPIYKQEMIRYFFVANQLAYQYQLNRLKDQLKTLIGYQFNKDIGNHQLYIFHANSGTEITNLHTLLKYSGKFIFATNPKAITLYRGYIRDKEAQQKLVNQIQRWRSVAPQQNEQIDSFKTKPADHYHRLFDNVQKKRDRFPRSKKKPIGLLKSSQFIDRNKLCKQDQIFQ